MSREADYYKLHNEIKKLYNATVNQKTKAVYEAEKLEIDAKLKRSEVFALNNVLCVLQELTKEKEEEPTNLTKLIGCVVLAILKTQVIPITAEDIKLLLTKDYEINITTYNINTALEYLLNEKADVEVLANNDKVAYSLPGKNYATINK